MVDLLTLFRKRVTEAPDREAVRYGGECLTYRELDTRIRCLAARILEHDARPDELVAVSVERSVHAIVALLAVLQSGATCLPLDRSYPSSRLDFMLEDSGARILLTDDPSGVAWNVNVIEITETVNEPDHDGYPARDPEENDLAYVVYTSGSTGEPKGVAYRRGGLSRLVEWQVRTYAEDSEVRTAQFTSYSFDVAFQEILATLGAGGTLVVVPEDVRQDVSALLRFLQNEGIRRVFLPTAILHPLADAAQTAPEEPALRDIFVAGEQLRITGAIRAWMRRMREARLHNQYGPAETHVVSAHTLSGSPDDWPVVPTIGSPLPHVDHRIVDEQGHEVEPDVVGELWLGGDCLARSYLHRPELTELRFPVVAEQRWYRTGDLVSASAMVGSEVDLSFHGRRDRQVKIRGFRVEPSEIEAVLAGHPGIADVAVVSDVHERNTNTRLVAYVVARADEVGEADLISRWRAYALAELPAYMVPTVWQVLDRLPTLPNGKVDRDSLPKVTPDRPMLTVPYLAPRDATERLIADILADELGFSRVGIDDNFFDLGGTSLLLAGVALRLRTALDVQLPLVTLFEVGNVRKLAEYLHTRTGSQAGCAQRPRPRVRPSGGEEESASIAIVGMACRFPGANTPAEFWAKLMARAELLTSVATPPDAGADFVPSASLLENIADFDARFFGLSEREAALMDPQHRLFLECSWEALEDAGAVTGGEGPVIGVFGGAAPSTYLINYVNPAEDWRPDRNFVDSGDDVRLLLANDKDFLASRVSYQLDLRGPSVNVNAACATSLFAVHLAARSLRDGESDVAVAGAATIPVPQVGGYRAEPGMPLSPDGHCKPFDADAGGTVFGSGVGAVVLKRLDDALADGDEVYAVLAGSAMNNDGAGKVGMAAPSIDGQARAISEALNDAGITPETLSFVEAHGTATPVGDPIELHALRRVYGSLPTGSVPVGSVKSNLGHLGWAAGMAGLLKAVLSLRYGRFPATMHFRTPNPELGLEESPFYVSDRPVALSEEHHPHRAGVSAFGLGGANAHLVLEAAPSSREPSGTDAAWHVVPLSARSPAALAELADRHHRYLSDQPELDVADVAYTLGSARRHYEVRRGLVVNGRDDLLCQLQRAAHGSGPDELETAHAESGRVVGLFTGHGGEYHGMGQRLADVSPVFRARLDSFDQRLQDELGRTAGEMLYAESADGSPISDVIAAQVLTFVVQLALVDVWESVGLHLDIALGHSLGEFAAATVAGMLTPNDGLTLVLERGRLMSRPCEPGGMAMVRASEADVRCMLAKVQTDLDIAAVNTPSNTVLSGHASELDRVLPMLTDLGVSCRRLHALRAGHSALMEPLLDDFEELAGGIELRTPRLDLISNVTGKRVTGEQCTPKYWREHLRQTVQFRSGIDMAAKLGGSTFVEIGGHPILLSMAQEVLPDAPGPWVPSMRRGEDDEHVLGTALAELYASGHRIDWLGVHGRRRVLHLPTYPFQRDQHWVNPPESSIIGGQVATGPASAGRTGTYDLRWEETKPLAQTTAAVGHWVLLCDSGGVADAFCEELQRRSATCTRVRHGDDPTELETVLAAHPDAGLVDLVGLSVSSEDVDFLEAMRPRLEFLLRGAQQRASAGGGGPLWVVTQGAQAVLDEDAVAPPQSAAWGVGRALAVEEPALGIRRLDLDPAQEVDPRLVVDLLLGAGEETECAMRGSRGYVSRLVPTTVTAAGSPAVRADASYLITGGLGGLGRWTARELIELGARKLVLVSRGDPSPEVVQELDELRQQNVEIVLASADVSNPDQVDHVLDVATCGDWPLRGIVHCAGEIDDGLLADMGWSRFRRVLGAKAQGAWNLHAATVRRDIRLDHFVLFSSATSLIGNFAQTNYAAANAYLDGLAQYRRGADLPAVAVNWGVWGEVGAVREDPDLLDQLRRRGTGTLTAADGRAGLYHALTTHRARIAVLPNDWTTWVAQHNVAEVPQFSALCPSATRDRARVTGLRATVASAAPEDRADILRNHVRGLIEQMTGVVDGGADTFQGMGLDSLSATQVRNSLQRTLSCSLPPRLLFDYPTTEQLVDHLLSEISVGEWLGRAQAADELVADPTPSESEHSAENTRPAIPLTVQQRRWLRLTREVGYGQRVVPVIVHAELDRPCLREALRTVVGRHDLLRYRYHDNGVEVLGIEETIPEDDALFSDLTGIPDDARSAEVAEHVRACWAGMPDPQEHPSWMIRCLVLTESRFLLLVGAQHLEFDGSGLAVFTDELCHAYWALLHGEIPELSEVTQYAEYAEHQAAYLATDIETDRAYFEGVFTQIPATTRLAGCTDLTTTKAAPASRYTPERPLVTFSEITALSEKLGVSSFAMLLASYAELVATISGEDDAVLGVIRSGRSDIRFASTIGPFTAPFPLPVRVTGLGPKQLVTQCDRLVTAMTSRADYPPTDLIDKVAAFEGLPYDTYFTDTCINFLNYRHQDKETLRPRMETPEILGNVEHPDLVGADFGSIRRIPGFHLVVEPRRTDLMANYWFHTDRFGVADVSEWAVLHRDIMDRMVSELR